MSESFDSLHDSDEPLEFEEAQISQAVDEVLEESDNAEVTPEPELRMSAEEIQSLFEDEPVVSEDDSRQETADAAMPEIPMAEQDLRPITEDDVVDTETIISEAEHNDTVVRVEIAQLRQKTMKAGVKSLVDTKLIEKLVKTGKIEIDEVESFIEKGMKESGDLRQYAVSAGFMSDAEIGQIVTELTGMKMIDLTDRFVSSDILKMFPSDFAYQWQAIPIGRTAQDQTLMVAISDPTDLQAKEAIVNLLEDEKNLLWRFATKRNIQAALDRLYTDGMDDMVEEILGDQEIEQDFTVRENDSGTTAFVNEIINRAHQAGASDIHIEPHEKHAEVRMRVDGMLRVTVKRLDKTMALQVVSQIKSRSNLRTDEKRLAQNGRFAATIGGSKIDFRVATMPALYGEDLVMRILDSSSIKLSLEQLGMSPRNLERYMAAITKPHGCAFVTGPTGSGKSTTLYASINRILDPTKKIITVEDPVEYNIEGITQVNIAGGNSEKVMTFPTSLKAAMRCDPDIIVIGEIRDEQTASIAIEAALTGHFVYSSLHTNDALSSITRMERLGVERFLVAEAVEVLVAQRLVRRLCPECRVPFSSTAEYLEACAPLPTLWPGPRQEKSLLSTVHLQKAVIFATASDTRGERVSMKWFLWTSTSETPLSQARTCQSLSSSCATRK